MAAARKMQSIGTTSLRRGVHKAACSLEDWDDANTAQCEHYVGRMDCPCTECGAKLFPGEYNANGIGKACCAHGKAKDLPRIWAASDEHTAILDNSSYRRYAYRLNEYFQMAQCLHSKCDLPQEVLRKPGTRNLVLKGKGVKKLVAVGDNLLGKRTTSYIFDADGDLVGVSGSKMVEEARGLYAGLHDVLNDHNIYVKAFKLVWKGLADDAVRAGSMPHLSIDLDEVRASSKTGEEFTNDFANNNLKALYDIGDSRQYSAYDVGGKEKLLNDFSADWEPLMFPLIHTAADHRSGYRIPSDDPDNVCCGISAKQYGAFHLFQRFGEPINIAVTQGRLSEQFILELALKAIAQDLLFFASAKTFAMNRTTAAKAKSGEALKENLRSARVMVGRRTGGEEAKVQKFNDCMAIGNRLGPPDYFITMTTNPKWREIRENLIRVEKPNDRVEVVQRVFDLKLKHLVDLLFKDSVLGEATALVGVVEYQKRGLPHAHLLVWVDTCFKPTTPSALDMVCSAVIPDIDTQPKLYELVVKQSMHPCCEKQRNAQCKRKTKDGKWKCKSNFPKPFHPVSVVDSRMAYATPMRPDDGRKKVATDEDRAIVRRLTKNPKAEPYEPTNQYVVTYNPFLTATFNSHVNIEPVASHHAIKYLYKYLHKRDPDSHVKFVTHDADQNPAKKPDLTEKVMKQVNKVQMGSVEAAAHLLGSKMFHSNPPVMLLAVHEEGGQYVYYHASDDEQTLKDKAAAKVTTLEAFFAANKLFVVPRSSGDAALDQEVAELRQEMEGFNTLTYNRVPEFFFFCRESSRWKPRREYTWNRTQQRFVRNNASASSKLSSIGRMAWVPPSNPELVCIKHVLCTRSGITSFEDLRTHNGTAHASVRAAAEAMGLAGEEAELVKRTMAEAAATTLSPKCLRFTFFCLITNFAVSETMVCELWEQYKAQLCKAPLQHAADREREALDGTLEEATPQEEAAALLDMQRLFADGPGGRTMEEVGLPAPDPALLRASGIRGSGMSWVIESEKYPMDAQWEKYSKMYPMLNDDQKSHFDLIRGAIESKRGGVFIVQGAAGTGKTFLYETLLAWGRSHRGEQGRQSKGVMLAVASSGIAATLLTGGRTAHNRFRIPIDIDYGDNERLCSLNKQQEELIRMADGFVWDEILMAPRASVEIVDRTCRAVRCNNAPFGGLVALLGGDFRQILPVVDGSTWGNTDALSLEQCINNSYLWGVATKIALTKQMRQKDDLRYAKFLSAIGDGSLSNNPDNTTALPEDMFVKSKTPGGKITPFTSEDLVEFVFPGLAQGVVDTGAILTVTNKAKDEINRRCLDILPGEAVKVVARNDVSDPSSVLDGESMATFDHPGVPLNVLLLKKGCIVMLMKNLNPSAGLCNGTRMVVEAVTDLNLSCRLLSNNTLVNIPRCKTTVDKKKAPFEFERTQFPVCLAYSITINKSQGQTLGRCGVDLSLGQCFAHGQLYVALSRVRGLEFVRVCLPTGANSEIFAAVNRVCRDLLSNIVGVFVAEAFVKLTADELEAIRAAYRIDVRAYSLMAHQLCDPPEREDAHEDEWKPQNGADLVQVDDVGFDDEYSEEDDIPSIPDGYDVDENIDCGDAPPPPPNQSKCSPKRLSTSAQRNQSPKKTKILTGDPRTLGLTVVSTPGDGDCLYHSLLHCMRQAKIDHPANDAQALRTAVNEHAMQTLHEHHEEAFETVIRDVAEKTRTEDHIERVTARSAVEAHQLGQWARPGFWGNQSTFDGDSRMVQGFSDLMRCHVLTYSETSRQWDVTMPSGTGAPQRGDNVVVLNNHAGADNAPVHFSAVSAADPVQLAHDVIDPSVWELYAANAP